MADRGNNPTIGHSHHTREVVPVLVYRQGLVHTQLGARTTLLMWGLPCVNFSVRHRHKMVALFFPPSGLQETPYNYTSDGLHPGP